MAERVHVTAPQIFEGGWCYTETECLHYSTEYSEEVTSSQFSAAINSTHCLVGTTRQMVTRNQNGSSGISTTMQSILEPTYDEIFVVSSQWVDVDTVPKYQLGSDGYYRALTNVRQVADGDIVWGDALFTLNCTDTYKINDTYDQGGGYWRVYTGIITDITTYAPIVPTCPPCSIYKDGTCVADEGCERNLDCPDCSLNCDCFINICCPVISGPTEINCNTLNQYLLTYPLECDDKENIVFLSYTGSTLVNGVDFYAPTQIIMPYGQDTYPFTIEVNDNVVGNMKISSSSDICFEEFNINVTCNDIIIPPIESGYSCEDIGFFWEPYGHKTKLPSYML